MIHTHDTSAACSFLFFFFNDTATTEIYPLSLHDALPICSCHRPASSAPTPSSLSPPTTRTTWSRSRLRSVTSKSKRLRSEEHTSELQSQSNLVCRLLLEKKKKNQFSTSYLMSRSTLSQPE